jgi:hypothetical protein
MYYNRKQHWPKDFLVPSPYLDSVDFSHSAKLPALTRRFTPSPGREREGCGTLTRGAIFSALRLKILMPGAWAQGAADPPPALRALEFLHLLWEEIR